MTKNLEISEHTRRIQMHPKPWDAIQMRQLLSPFAALTASISKQKLS